MVLPYLETNTLAVPQFRIGRRRKRMRGRTTSATGAIVIHTAEWTPDTVGVDRAAEQTAEWMTRRTSFGSYHRIVDSDSIVPLVDFKNEAFHDGTGGNEFSIGLSIATQAALWPRMPAAWRHGAIRNLALAAAEANAWLILTGNPPCPARIITRSDYWDGKPGFIAHGAIDPGRRTDPGAKFPWQEFLAEYKRLITPDKPKQPDPIEPTTPDPEDIMPASPVTITFDDYMSAVYNHHLGREIEPGGLNNYRRRFVLGELTLEQIDREIGNSPEALKRLL